MKKRFLKTALLGTTALLLWNCSDDSSSSTSPAENSSASVSPVCDIDAIAAQYPIWTGVYFIYASGAVTDGTNSIGTFDASTGHINDASGITIATVDISALPYFDGTNLIYRNCLVTNVPGDTLGQMDETGNLTPVSSSSEDPTLSSAATGLSSAGAETSSASTGNSSASTGLSSATPESSSSLSTGDLSSSSNASGSSSSASLGETPTLNSLLTTGGSGVGWSSRYWDACKPHCSWPGNVDTTSEATYQAGLTTAKNCNIHDVEVPTYTLSENVQQYWMGYQGTTSACGGGSAGVFTCTDMAPVAVNDTLSYGYVAAPGANAACGKCFHLQFNGGNHDGNIKATHKALKGKHMIVMASNIGNDVEVGQFDMMVPGGGVGMYDALSTMVSGSNIELGETYGGFLTTCQKSLGYDNTVANYQSCIEDMCDNVFTGYPNLLRGCKWFAEWYMAADNPTYNWEPIECPQYLVDNYKTSFNTTKENRYEWHDDWSTYNEGDVLDTLECLSANYPQGCGN